MISQCNEIQQTYQILFSFAHSFLALNIKNSKYKIKYKMETKTKKRETF